MRLYSSFLILLVGISCATSHDPDYRNHTNGQVEVQNNQKFDTNHLTVQTDVEAGKTTSGTLGQGRELAQGRTFGIKRLQFMLLPVMYKMGVMTTLLVVLVAVALKSLLIGVILLVLKVGSFFAKFHQPYHQVAPVVHESSWSPPWPQPQPVHVHMHYDDFPHSPTSHDHYDRQGQQIQEQVFSGWDRSPPSGPYGQAFALNSQGQYVYRG